MRASQFDAYKDIFISLSRDRSCCPLPTVFQALADPTRLRILALLRIDGAVGRRAGAGPRPKPAARVAPSQDPRRRRRRRAPQGRQLGVPDAGRPGARRAAVRADRSLGRRAGRGAVRRRRGADSRRSAPTAPRPPPAISPPMPRCGTRSARSTSPKARSSGRSTARSATGRSAGWSTSAPAPGG